MYHKLPVHTYHNDMCTLIIYNFEDDMCTAIWNIYSIMDSDCYLANMLYSFKDYVSFICVCMFPYLELLFSVIFNNQNIYRTYNCYHTSQDIFCLR